MSSCMGHGITALMVAFFYDFDCWWFKFLPRFWVLWQNDLGAIWQGRMDNLVQYWFSYLIIYMKKILHSDWLRAAQFFLKNGVEKS